MKPNVIFLSVYILRLACVLISSVSAVNAVPVYSMEGDSVTLHTGVRTNQQDRIKWYFNNTRIAQINRDQSKICTDVQCNEGTERFRDRLKLDHQTGSLTIRNIQTEQTGLYKLQLISNHSREETFNISVYDVTQVDKMKTLIVEEGGSVTLDPGVIKNPHMMMWFFNHTLIAKISRDQSQICTDDECKERFRDRLTVDHHTGSLIITNTTTGDSSLYELRIISGSTSIIKRFEVVLIDLDAETPASLSCILLLFFSVILTAACGIYCFCWRNKRQLKEKDNVQLDVGQADKIPWMFGREGNVAEINNLDKKLYFYDDALNEKYTLRLDEQTGSLTVRETNKLWSL